MGQGYLVKCRNCNYEELLNLGVGMFFPGEYRKLIKMIEDGEYGAEPAEYFLNNPGAVVDAQLELYYCSECHNYEVDYNLSLYRHKDNREISNGYWLKQEDYDREYVFVKAYKHICNRCGKHMHKIRESEMNNLVCPECGKPLEVSTGVMWD
ncbi:MAG: hypothetical protein IJG49_04865 [Erysipelotrichaceae bacterium]|nr:hypothetical protein [Erysipelotrichaceae bacterium]